MLHLLQAITDLSTRDKMLALIGTLVATLNLSHVSTLMGILVGACTVALLVPSFLMKWDELRASRAKARIERQRAELLEEAERRLRGCGESSEGEKQENHERRKQ